MWWFCINSFEKCIFSKCIFATRRMCKFHFLILHWRNVPIVMIDTYAGGKKGLINGHGGPLLLQWPILQVCLRVLHWIYNGDTHKWSISNSPDQIMPHVHPEQWLWFRLWLDLYCSYKVSMYACLCYWKWRSFYQICGPIAVCTQWPSILYSLSCGVNHKLTTALYMNTHPHGR